MQQKLRISGDLHFIDPEFDQNMGARYACGKGIEIECDSEVHFHYEESTVPQEAVNVILRNSLGPIKETTAFVGFK